MCCSVSILREAAGVEESPGRRRGCRRPLQQPFPILVIQEVRAEAVLLVLTLRDRRSYPAYEVKIRDSGGEVVWSSTALQRAPEGFFTLELPRRFLPAGRYRIAVRGIDGDRPEPVATYGLEIEE